MRRQGCADSRIIRHDFIATIDQALVPNDLKQVPDRLYVSVIERVISFIQVDPESHALGHLFPVADVAHDGLAASPRELGNPYLFLDLFLVEYAELFFDLVLDG